VVGTVASVLAGGVGTFTSGGTESCLLAVKATRDPRSDVDGPEVVLPVTAHPACHKAAHYLGLTVVATPVDADFRAIPDAVAEAITGRTVLVVASAPSYPTGTVDPVPVIAAAAAARGVRCHVDACIGGCVLPFLPDPPPFDLSVPGVSSLAVDLHKYGYTPKGASVLLFAAPELRRHAWYAYAGWPGYPVNQPRPCRARSRPARWPPPRRCSRTSGWTATGTVALAARDALLRLAAGVSAMDGLLVLGEPDSTLLAMAGSPEVDVFVVADELRARGFYAQVQLSLADVPPNLHFSAHAISPSTVDALLSALGDSVDATRARGPAVPADLAAVALSTMDEQGFTELLASAGLDSMAAINATLDRLPVPAREQALRLFLSVLLTPRSATTRLWSRGSGGP
jgi:sphinganine-1-phosphate aldolase